MKTLSLALLTFLAFALVACGDSADADPTASPTATSEATQAAGTATAEAAETATEQPTEAPTEEPPAGIGDGIHQVPGDIAPGVYRTTDVSFCYWERLSGFGGTLGEINANGTAMGAAEIVEVLATDVGFNSQNCGEWQALDSSALTPLTTFGDGTFVVGAEVAPGNWSAPGGDACYFERLSAFTGNLDAIISNNLSAGAVVAAIAPTDVGFRTHGCGEWTQ